MERKTHYTFTLYIDEDFKETWDKVERYTEAYRTIFEKQLAEYGFKPKYKSGLKNALIRMLISDWAKDFTTRILETRKKKEETPESSS